MSPGVIMCCHQHMRFFSRERFTLRLFIMSMDAMLMMHCRSLKPAHGLRARCTDQGQGDKRQKQEAKQRQADNPRSSPRFFRAGQARREKQCEIEN